MIESQRLYRSQAERRHNRSLKAKRIATRGEQLAAQYLQDKAYQLIARNYRAGRAGEIDIVLLDPSDVVVFVEVKTRTTDGPVFGIPELGFEAVGYRKQRRILIASQKFMAQPNFSSKRWRYDVIVIGIPRDQARGEIEITHVENAFD
jgi:putative endonuclease